MVGQVNDNSISPSSIEMADLYLQKQKTNKTMGFVMLGAGIAMIAGGLAINVNTGWGEGNKNNGLWLSAMGVPTALVSVPLFVSAGTNKRKARLLLKTESVTINKGISEKSDYPEIVLQIQF